VRVLSILIATVGLAGAVALVSVTGARMRTPVDADPASEIRESVPVQPAPPKLTETSPKPIAEPSAAPEPSVTVAEAPPAPPRPDAPPRSVAPSIIAIPPVDPQALERVEARPPLSEIAQAVPPKKPPPKPLLFQPVAEAGGIIVAGGRTITIAGVKPVVDGEICDRQGGATWPCGRAARSAFRAFLRGRAVTCDFPEGEVPDALSTTCRLGPRDIGAWLVENGWARPDGDTYATQAAAAEKAGRGVFGPGLAALPAEPSGLDVAPSPGLASPAGAGPADISILPAAGDAPVPAAATGEPQSAPPETGPSPPVDQGVVREPLPPPVSPPARPAPQ